MDPIRLEEGQSVQPIYPETTMLILRQNQAILEMNTKILSLATTVRYIIKKED